MQTSKSECAICGYSAALPVTVRREVSVGRRKTIVEDEYIRCDRCGGEYTTPEQMERTQRKAVAKIRAEEDLLSPDEIVRIRHKLCLTQAQLEALLRTGPKTVVRWERGTVFQSRAADSLLRLIDCESKNVKILKEIAKLPPAELDPPPAQVIREERDRR